MEELYNNLEMEVGGITYYVDCVISEEKVSKVVNVKVWLSIGNWKRIDMSREEMNKFFEMYEENLNYALLEELESNRLAEEDMKYETAREEGYDTNRYGNAKNLF